MRRCGWWHGVVFATGCLVATAQLGCQGRLEIEVSPPDATVLLDQLPVNWRRPIQAARGSHLLSVFSPGYVREDQTVEVRLRRKTHRLVNLAVAAGTGFELTSTPSGELVSLDGIPRSGPEGQFRTPWKADRVAPGRHVVGIGGNPRLLDWRQEFEIVPGFITRLSAALVETTPPLGPLIPREPHRIPIRENPPRDHAGIARVVTNNQEALSICYRRLLLRGSTLTRGKIMVRLRIGLRGRVMDVAVDAPFPGASLESCIRQYAVYWAFPPTTGEYEVAIPVKP